MAKTRKHYTKKNHKKLKSKKRNSRTKRGGIPIQRSSQQRPDLLELEQRLRALSQSGTTGNPAYSIFERDVESPRENMINNHCEKLDRIINICQDRITWLTAQNGDDEQCREVISQIQNVITFG